MATHRVLAAIACLMGAAGVAAAAGSAHVDATFLAPAAQLLMVHAVASLAVLALLRPAGGLAVTAIAGMEAGGILFAADMAMRTFHGAALFAMAAPIGGSVVILSWLVAALAMILPRPQ